MKKTKSLSRIYSTIILLVFFCFASCEKNLSENEQKTFTEETSSEPILELAYPDKKGTLTEIAYLGQRLPVEKFNEDYVYQGDIILTPQKDAKGVGRSLRRYRWPDNTVFFTIDSTLTNRTRVVDAIDHWENNTNLRFIERTTEPNYIHFRPGLGCSSNVGMIGGRQFITLARGCTTGTTIHEIGHAIGLWHEQSREDRNVTVQVNFENIQNGRDFNFETYGEQNQDGEELSGALDLSSIMMYHPCSFAIACLPAQICNCSVEEATIVRRSFGGRLYEIQRDGLSRKDINSVKRMYPLASPWLTGNSNGFTNRIVTLSRVDGLVVREQGGYGIVNTAIKGGIFTSSYTSNNFNGVVKRTNFIAQQDFATGIEVKEQYGYGIIDLRLTNSSGQTSWATRNNNEDRILKYEAPVGMAIKGIQTQEQYGYGIVDIRVILERMGAF